MKFYFFLVGLFLTSLQLMGQHVYEANAVFKPLQKQIEVRQKMVFFNHSSATLQKIFIYDWNNAYTGGSAPLSKKLSDDFNFRFEKSAASDKGMTNVLNFYAEGRTLFWKRLENQPDIIEVEITEGIPPGTSLPIVTDYNLKLPSDRFTGYGISTKKELKLNNWQLLFAFLHADGTWALDSNLGFDDISLQPASHQFSFSYPKDMQLAISVAGKTSVNDTFTKWTGANRNTKKISFELHYHSHFDTLNVGKNLFVTDLAYKSFHLEQANENIDQLMGFVASFFPLGEADTWFLQSLQYEKHPIVGIDLLYNTLKPLPQHQILTLKMAKTLIYKLVYDKTLSPYRNQPWIVDGLAQYLFMRYIDSYHADLKLVGNLDNILGFKNYEFSKAHFNDRHALLAGFATRQNVTQALNTPNDQLSKYNRTIANPAKFALGLKVLQKHEGNFLIDRCIRSYFFQNPYTMQQQASFKNIVLNATEDRASWFFDGYLSETALTDYALKAKKENDTYTVYTITNPSQSKAPISLALYKEDSLVHTMWMAGGVPTQKLRLESRFANRAVLNPDLDIVEMDLNNNNVKTNSKTGRRNIKVSLFEDLPTSHAKQWFVVPDISFNAYDGLLSGLMVNNGLAMKHPLFISVSPQYSTKGSNLNGEAKIIYKKYFQDQPLSQIQYGLSFQSYHYAPDLRYYRFSPSISWNFRPYGINDNRRSVFDLRYISLSRENDVAQLRLPGYDLGMISYLKSNYSSAETQSLFAGLQVGDAFSKLSISYTHRKFYKEAKQFYFRVFGGAFLYNNDPSFYNIGVSRINDYAFSYKLFGRSENSGFYSQQFVMAEGGFKSFLGVSQADKWILATNLSTTLWRSFEIYTDLGVVKNNNNSPSFIYDSGFGINIVQNYLQLYFPVYSNSGWEVDDDQYASKIRFTLAADPEELFALFTRSWF